MVVAGIEVQLQVTVPADWVQVPLLVAVAETNVEFEGSVFVRTVFVPGDVLEMDFRDEFDLAVTVGSLGHILPKDEPRFVERIAAALKPGGRFAFVTAEMPPWWSRRYLFSRAFNAAMHLRNFVKRPPFIMYYLTFLWPDVKPLLEQHGFDVVVHEDAFKGKLRFLKVVVATKQR